MPLADVSLEKFDDAIPGDVGAFLREAEQRIEAFQHETRVPGFVPSNLEEAYRVLRGVAEKRVKPGALFCEWGSGFGVIACLAAMLDFDAVGIEIEDVLVDEAEKLAHDFDVPVEFLRGSFLPHGSAIHAEVTDGLAWLREEEAEPEGLAFDVHDFEVIFAYPWPDEADVTSILFERYARTGALLVSFHGGDEFRLRRKVARKARR